MIGYDLWIRYKLPKVSGDEILKAGPYKDIDEAKQHFLDIQGYEDVEDVCIIWNVHPSKKGDED